MPTINSGKFVKRGDLKEGDILTFQTAGDYIEKDFNKGDGPQTIFEIDVSFNGEESQSMILNKTSMYSLADNFGRKTEEWVGKKAKVTFQKMMSFGNIQDVLVLVPIETKTEEEVWTE